MKGRSSASLFGIMISVFWFFAFHCVLVLANVEKDIFIAPQPGSIPSELAQLELATLTPSKPCIRLRLDAMFPTDTEPLGEASWFLLEDLNPGQRYEVRACWLATQPTSFTLTARTASSVLDSDSLLSSVTDFAGSVSHKPINPRDENDPVSAKPPKSTGSSLFLSVHAAASYFTLNETLMAEVPPVYVDLILDPYILNVAPRSVLPTMAYVTFVAVIGWFLADFVRFQMLRVVSRLDPTKYRDVKKGEMPKKRRQDRISFFHIF